MVQRDDVKQKGADPPGHGLILCKECSTLAMILLDGIPLCRTCVVQATADREITWIRNHSRPLGIMGLVKARDHKNKIENSGSGT